MKIQNIGVMSPGDMGQAVAQQLKQKGFNVLTALDKRSARTKALAQEAGLADVGSLKRLTEQCDLILSVMAPAGALDFATELAEVLRANQRKLLFVECNAIAPAKMHEINAKITATGSRCIDAGIIGNPPRGNAPPMQFYVSGPEAKELEQLGTPQIVVRVMNERIGDASSIKMCYSAMNKGIIALGLELLVVARRLGVDVPLEAQFMKTHAEIHDKIIRLLPRMPPKAHRWVPEMLEISRTFESVDMPPGVFEGIANVYEYIAGTSLGKETPENRDTSRGGKEVVKVIADERRK